jgi:phosphohistidine phosphatase
MKQLYLLRHAKSSWDDSSLDDHDRPLAPRGECAARLIARYVRDKGIRPGLVLCSTALRATQTLEPLRAEIGGDTEVLIERELYGALHDEILNRLRHVPESVGSVLMIGHNPGMEDLALALFGRGPLRLRLEEKFPTAALATLAVSVVWSQLGRGNAELVDYVTPKDLA